MLGSSLWLHKPLLCTLQEQDYENIGLARHYNYLNTTRLRRRHAPRSCGSSWTTVFFTRDPDFRHGMTFSQRCTVLPINLHSPGYPSTSTWPPIELECPYKMSEVKCLYKTQKLDFSYDDGDAHQDNWHHKIDQTWDFLCIGNLYGPPFPPHGSFQWCCSLCLGISCTVPHPSLVLIITTQLLQVVLVPLLVASLDHVLHHLLAGLSIARNRLVFLVCCRLLGLPHPLEILP